MLGELHKGPQAQKNMQNIHNHGNKGGDPILKVHPNFNESLSPRMEL